MASRIVGPHEFDEEGIGNTESWAVFFYDQLTAVGNPATTEDPDPGTHEGAYGQPEAAATGAATEAAPPPGNQERDEDLPF